MLLILILTIILSLGFAIYYLSSMVNLVSYVKAITENVEYGHIDAAQYISKAEAKLDIVAPKFCYSLLIMSVSGVFIYVIY